MGTRKTFAHSVATHRQSEPRFFSEYPMRCAPRTEQCGHVAPFSGTSRGTTYAPSRAAQAERTTTGRLSVLETHPSR